VAVAAARVSRAQVAPVSAAKATQAARTLTGQPQATVAAAVVLVPLAQTQLETAPPTMVRAALVVQDRTLRQHLPRQLQLAFLASLLVVAVVVLGALARLLRAARAAAVPVDEPVVRVALAEEATQRPTQARAAVAAQTSPPAAATAAQAS